MGISQKDFQGAADVIGCEPDEVLMCIPIMGMPPDRSQGTDPFPLVDTSAYPFLKKLPFISDFLQLASHSAHGPADCECCGGETRAALKLTQQHFAQHRATCLKTFQLKGGCKPTHTFHFRSEQQQKASTVPSLEEWHRLLPAPRCIPHACATADGKIDQDRVEGYTVFGYVAAQPYITDLHTKVLLVHPSCEPLVVAFRHRGSKSMQACSSWHT